MRKKLAIKGHPTRGNEIIELLEMMGGKNTYGYNGRYFIDEILYTREVAYYIDFESQIRCIDIKNITTYFIVYSIEMFLKEYPFKVGDKVFLYDNITEGCVTGMEWDENKGTIKYCVYTSGECWCDVEELLKWNTIDLDEKHHEKQCDEIQTQIDMDNTMFMLGHTLVPNKMDDKLEYNIINGYEFDKVENGKIILKPIKNRYPNTYKECCDILGIGTMDNDAEGYKADLIIRFQELLIARDAYWKIAGDEMGLGKPWEPRNAKDKYIIRRAGDTIVKGYDISCVLEFPTKEMRDAFYDNLRILIENCKELL